MLALRRAYADAGVSPNSVSLVEAHGTGTVAGDRAEIEALKQVFEESGADKARVCGRVSQDHDRSYQSSCWPGILNQSR